MLGRVAGLGDYGRRAGFAFSYAAPGTAVPPKKMSI